jgi:cobalt-zinc-cadmium efflux system protein
MDETIRNYRALLITLGLTVGYLIVEVVSGLLTNSLALIADGVHMFTDSGALALAALASWMTQKPATYEKTYGYHRAEILAAFTNAFLLLAGSLFVLYEAYRRFQQPRHVVGLPMLIVATVGLFVNLAGAWILRQRSRENLNTQAAFYEVAKDALGSLGVIVAGIVILTTGWTYVDPLVSTLIAVLVFPRVWTLLRDAADVLLEAAPSDLDLEAIEQAMRQVECVQLVHDLHVWTITSGFVAMSAHVLVREGVDRKEAQAVLAKIRGLLRERFDIEHVTIQIEYRDLEEKEPEL